MRTSLIPLSLTLGLLTGILFTAGCSSDPGPRRHGGPDRAHRPPITPMAGEATYFQARLLAQINVGGSARAEAQGEAGSGGSAPEGNGGHRRRGGGGGMSMGMSAGGMDAGMGGERRGGGEFEGGGDEPRGPRPRMAPLGPLVMIHLRFTNQGTTPLDVIIKDFVSPLGNFAVQPDKLTLAPGQSLETEPMSSPVDGSLAEIDAHLVLRVGSETEDQSVRLKPIARPNAASAPAQ